MCGDEIRRVQVWPGSAERRKTDPFASIDRGVFVRVDGIAIALIDACRRLDGEQASGLVQPVTFQHGSHGVFAIAHALGEAIVSATGWTTVAAEAKAAAELGAGSLVESVTLVDCPVMFNADSQGTRLDQAAEFLSWFLTGRLDLALSQMRLRPLDSRELLEGLFEVTAGALGESGPDGGCDFADDGVRVFMEAAASGKLFFVHRGRFAGGLEGLTALVDCVQALIAAFVVKGAGLSVDPRDGGYVVQLARRVDLGQDIHQPVREIIEWHGGVYGFPVGDLDLTPPMPPGYGDGAVELRENVS